jgi:hypothetical protein
MSLEPRLSKRERPDLLTAVTYLTTRTVGPTMR